MRYSFPEGQITIRIGTAELLDRQNLVNAVVSPVSFLRLILVVQAQVVELVHNPEEGEVLRECLVQLP